MSILDALVIGAGPAGLATSRELGRHGIEHVVLERGAQVGETWANLYDSLVLHTGKHLSALPGLPFPRSTPLFPTRREFLEYLHHYQERFRLPVATGQDVAHVEPAAEGWRVHVAGGAGHCARALVVATGIVSNPHVPSIAGRERFRGRIGHSVEYRRPDGYAGRRVLIVGIGNSAGEIAVELARNGAHVVVCARSGRRAVPRDLAGIPIQYFAVALAALPRRGQRAVTAAISNLSERMRGAPVLPPPAETACADVPLIGLHLVDALRAGTIRLRRGDVSFTESGARFGDGSHEDFDEAILATGYRAALSPLGGLVRADDCGFAWRRGRVQSADHPTLFFVGHNYDSRGGLRNIAQDARMVGRAITALPGLP